MATSSSRRQFLKTSLLSTAALTSTPAFALEGEPQKTSQVSLTAGDDRADNIFKGLKAFESQIKQAIGNKRVVVKPNNVSISNQLCATHVDCLTGILEFLNSIGKTNVIIAESAASGPTFEGFDNYGYMKLEDNYPVKLVDLDKEPFEKVYVVSDRDFHPHAVRMSSILLDPDNYVISAAVMKTHDRVVATLSLKNIVFGAPIKDEGFRWGRGGKQGAQNDKPIAHGGGYRGVNYNLFAMAHRLHPDLAVIDGFEGMQGNGPVGGSPVDHRVAVVSPDWLAADRTAVELMGIDFSRIGYLNYCDKAGMGEADLNNIAILGEPISKHIKKYQLHKRVEDQMLWQQPMG